MADGCVVGVSGRKRVSVCASDDAGEQRRELSGGGRAHARRRRLRGLTTLWNSRSRQGSRWGPAEVQLSERQRTRARRLLTRLLLAEYQKGRRARSRCAHGAPSCRALYTASTTFGQRKSGGKEEPRLATTGEAPCWRTGDQTSCVTEEVARGFPRLAGRQLQSVSCCSNAAWVRGATWQSARAHKR